jgi:MSHA biogenesis protein MshP
MCHRQIQKSGMRQLPARQNGFAIVAAIFLLVILSALGAYMLVFSSVQHATSAQDVQGERAYQAARAGVEWGTYQILQNNATGFAAACRTATPGTTTQVLPTLAGTLSAFTVNVSCSTTPYTEGSHLAANPLWMYRITSTAAVGVAGQTNYVARQMQITLED